MSHFFPVGIFEIQRLTRNTRLNKKRSICKYQLPYLSGGKVGFRTTIVSRKINFHCEFKLRTYCEPSQYLYFLNTLYNRSRLRRWRMQRRCWTSRGWRRMRARASERRSSEKWTDKMNGYICVHRWGGDGPCPPPLVKNFTKSVFFSKSAPPPF